MCVGVYLIWGCRAPFRLLGLVVMPLAVVLLALAWAAGGVGEQAASEFGDAFLAFHVGLILAAFAGFTLGPNGPHECRLLHQFAGMLHQIQQGIERRTGKRYDLAVSAGQ
jgi:hypothetical protein